MIIAVVFWLYVRKRKGTTADLRQKFGPEYDRAVLVSGLKAEAKLADREKRVDKLNIRDLDAMEHDGVQSTVAGRAVRLWIPRRGPSWRRTTWCLL